MERRRIAKNEEIAGVKDLSRGCLKHRHLLHGLHAHLDHQRASRNSSLEVQRAKLGHAVECLIQCLCRGRRWIDFGVDGREVFQTRKNWQRCELVRIHRADEIGPIQDGQACERFRISDAFHQLCIEPWHTAESLDSQCRELWRGSFSGTCGRLQGRKQLVPEKVTLEIIHQEPVDWPFGRWISNAFLGEDQRMTLVLVFAAIDGLSACQLKRKDALLVILRVATFNQLDGDVSKSAREIRRSGICQRVKKLLLLFFLIVQIHGLISRKRRRKPYPDEEL